MKSDILRKRFGQSRLLNIEALDWQAMQRARPRCWHDDMEVSPPDNQRYGQDAKETIGD